MLHLNEHYGAHVPINFEIVTLDLPLPLFLHFLHCEMFATVLLPEGIEQLCSCYFGFDILSTLKFPCGCCLPIKCLDGLACGIDLVDVPFDRLPRQAICDRCSSRLEHSIINILYVHATPNQV